MWNSYNRSCHCERTPNLPGQHGRWWSKVYARGIRLKDIVHKAGKESQHADILSRQPVLPAQPDYGTNKEDQIALIFKSQAVNIGTLLHKDRDDAVNCIDGFMKKN